MGALAIYKAATSPVQAIAQAAAYPKQVSMLASVIVSGDQAAANRAPAPEEDKAEAPVDEVTVKVKGSLHGQGIC